MSGVDQPLAWLGAQPAPGCLRFVAAPGSHSCSGGVHSSLADGRRLCWVPLDPPGPVAVDAEVADQAVPSALSRRIRGSVGTARGAWWRWTRAEVCAKLLDVPIVVWVTRHGWPDEDVVRHDGRTIVLRTTRLEGVVVTVGTMLPSSAQARGSAVGAV